jgi:uncharacterized protein
MYDRTLDIYKLLKKKSFFLFGPRATGKSTLIKHQLKNATVFDLLDAEVFRDLVRRPKILEETLSDKIIVIDEVQKLPSILDEVHRLIEKKKGRFLMTGSSARKLKRGAANLLAGRAWQANLFPLCSQEIDDFRLLAYLNTGGLPNIYANIDAKEELNEYVSTYLKEEIQAEALTRNITAFNEFLELIGIANGDEISFESLGRDCGVSPNSVKNYLQILEDTLIGFTLPGFTKTKKRKAISRIKHYFFDIGVVNNLCRRGAIEPKSELFGKAFEHFIVLECRSYINYSRKNYRMTYWRSKSQFEVDLIIENEAAIEIKSTELVQDKHLKGIRALKEEGLIRTYIIVSCDAYKRTTEDGIVIYPWGEFISALWQGKLF